MQTATMPSELEQLPDLAGLLKFVVKSAVGPRSSAGSRAF